MAGGRSSDPHGCLKALYTRDYLIAHRLSPIQCAPNMFRILGSVAALNKKIGMNLTHYDVNWIYNRHYLTG